MIQGIQDVTSSCKAISGGKLKGLIRRNAVSHCVEFHRIPSGQANNFVCTVQDDQLSDSFSHLPPAVAALINQFEHLFQEPFELPPSRQEDHHIPLIPCAQPVNIRSCRYSPHQKTEIITEILQKEVIQHSSSPFASPVLLVKKKDGT
jgi:hypothetical protein